MYTLIYDFETSGLNQYHADIIEIGCRCVETDEYFTTLIKPLSNKPVSSKIIEITGITNKLLKNQGINAKDAYIQFFDFIKKYYDIDNNVILLAHNGRAFDDIFLRRIHRYLQGEELLDYDIMVENIHFIDTLLLARYLYPERGYHSMNSMCGMFNITNNAAHRAMGDVDALTKIWKEMVKILHNKKQEISGLNLRYITHC